MQQRQKWPLSRRLSSSGLSMLALSATCEGRMLRRSSDLESNSSSASEHHEPPSNQQAYARGAERALKSSDPTREVPHQLLDCPPNFTGPYPTPTCAHYYYCDDGDIEDNLIYECGEGLLFSLDKGICDWEEGVRCDVDGSEGKAISAVVSHHGVHSNSSSSYDDQVEVDLSVEFQESASFQQSSQEVTTTLTRPTRPIRPIKPQVVNIETRDGILEVESNSDGSVTLTLVNQPNDTTSSAVDTVYVNQGPQQQQQQQAMMSQSLSQETVATQITHLPSYIPTESPTLPRDPISGLPYGPPIYYPNFALRKCDSNALYKPRWTSDSELFASKADCCREFFDWVPLETCLGVDFVEDNILTGAPTRRSVTHAPSTSPVSSALSSRPTSAVDVNTTVEETYVPNTSSVSNALSSRPTSAVDVNATVEETYAPNTSLVSNALSSRPTSAVDVNATAEEITVMAASSDAQGASDVTPAPSPLTPSLAPTRHPTPFPSISPTHARDPISGMRYGPPIYYPNYALQKCDSDPLYKPRWTPDEELFASKVACCELHFGHAVPECLGVGFVEDNLVTDAPATDAPTRSPSAVPSFRPSVDVSEAPSTIPSASFHPTRFPVGTPTFAPVTDEPTVSPSLEPSLTPSSSPPTVIPTISPSTPPSLNPTTKKPTKRPSHFMQALVFTPPPVVTTTTTSTTTASVVYVVVPDSPAPDGPTPDRPTIADVFSNKESVEPESSGEAEQELEQKSSKHDIGKGYGWHSTKYPTFSPTYTGSSYSPIQGGTDVDRSNTEIPSIIPSPQPYDGSRSINNTEIPTIMPSPQPSDGPRSIGLSIPLRAATVSEVESITAFGNDETIMVDGTIGNRYDAMLSVDLGFLMAVPDYTSIILRLFVLESNGQYCGTFQTTLNPWWDENSVTWMNAPGANGNILGDALITEESEWVELDVTEVLKEMRTESNTLFSVRLISNENNRCVFASDNGSNMLQAPNLLVSLQGKEVHVVDDDALGSSR